MTSTHWILLLAFITFIFTIGYTFGVIFYKKRSRKYKYRGFEIEPSHRSILMKGNLVLITDLEGNPVMNYRVINGVIQKETINTFD